MGKCSSCHPETKVTLVWARRSVAAACLIPVLGGVEQLGKVPHAYPRPGPPWIGESVGDSCTHLPCRPSGDMKNSLSLLPTHFLDQAPQSEEQAGGFALLLSMFSPDWVQLVIGSTEQAGEKEHLQAEHLHCSLSRKHF